jgi:tRNA pseudouridine38-40 synthase
MTNYRLTVQYDGTDYHGFQMQPDLPTIQLALENSIKRLGSLESPLYAAGRTDAGVHARGQVVSFKGEMKPETDRMPEALNAFLPRDIVVFECREVDDAFNARSSALAREYSYYLSLEKYPSPFNRRFTCHCGSELDEAKMAAALNLVLGKHDFAAFGKKTPNGSTVREVQEVGVFMGHQILAIRVKANAFIWMMMRMLCGSLLQVGRGKWSVEDFREVFESADSALAAPALPASGLVFERVYYQE